MSRLVGRRAFLGAAGASLAGAGIAAAQWKGRNLAAVDRASLVDPGPAHSLADIDHFVLLMQENRSFDHYFGTMSDVVGFDDAAAGASRQASFRLGSVDGHGDDLLYANPAHTWTAMHQMWNGGAVDPARVRGGTQLTRRAADGFFTRADLPVHYALADAFTVCDHYFSSVLGPTGSNRLFWMSGSLDAEGAAGGPIVHPTHDLAPGTLSWRTFPENLTDAGVSWKVYNAYSADKRSELSGMLKYFRAYQDPEGELARRGLAPRWPHDFVDDVRRGTLPSVSWVIPPWSTSEHPSHPPAVGAAGIMSVVRTLIAHPAVWERAAVIVSYDESGGFYDHVAPPVPPSTETGEFLTDRHFTRQPVGLGFRVPCLVISPLTRGGLVSSRTYDHTSQLRLIGKRFAVPVPNVSAWRRAVTSDLSELFEPAAPAPAPPPSLPSRADVRTMAEAALSARRAEVHEPTPPTTATGPIGAAPVQESSPRRRHI